MKKYFLLAASIVSLFLVTGCGKEEAKTIECTLNRKDVITNYELEAKYVINYVDSKVNTVETTEKVTSDSKTVLDTFKTTFDNSYGKMNDNYGGYDYKVKTTSNSVTSSVTVDYNKMDLNKLVKDEPTIKNLMTNKNKLDAAKMQKNYEGMGATCKKVEK